MDNSITKKDFISPLELLEIFPEGEKALNRNLRLLKKEMPAFKKDADKMLELFMIGVYERTDLSDSEKEFWIDIETFVWRDRILNQLQERQSRLMSFKKYINFKKSQTQKTISEIGPADILKAKDYPLTTFLKINRAGFSLCPFHPDRNASLKINKDNTWHCFGCGKGSDVIDFVMMQEGIDFITAVKRLI